MKPLARKDLNIQEIESIHQSYLLDSLDWQGDKTIDLSEDTKVLLSAMPFDHGDGGFFLFRFDNKDFGDYPPGFKSRNAPFSSGCRFRNPDKMPKIGNKKALALASAFSCMERVTRLELATSTLARWRSTG